ncbi:hypothetical protein CONPUDRAFT_44325 [Coniophora puteana RWD-64-598 SS2]|uniref:Nucleoporin Pom152 n=1 Tax=Coniophora puteana (strain RWD-64-598) TaxID=741705 RepID=A0A5M3N6R0_CONPW|nr:uncharacterized protein CONPUDRAFT_44325 [Coniophora puteana RWD-64-598 SS2]EIW87006.1 hypothetical protein CONPUDRAFT_44325 [Coniophora puteana RWD-64-598 SS2]
MSDKKQPLIPESFIDVPTQRLYYLSLGLLLQAAKVFDFLQSLVSESTSYYSRKWLAVDFLYITTLSALRIPRLRYAKAVVLLQIFLLWFLDGVMFGGISFNWRETMTGASPTFSGRPDLPSTPEPFRLLEVLNSVTLGLLPFSLEGSQKDKHLLGQHTVRMSPISTAQLNPDAQTFCLASPSSSVLIPVVVNNTVPTNIRYSYAPLTYIEGKPGTGRIEYADLSAKDIKAIEQARQESLQVARTNVATRDVNDDDYDEYDDDEYDEGDTDPQSRLQKTESLAHIRVTRPGTIRLERVLDSSNTGARLFYPSEVTVAPCPTAQYQKQPAAASEYVRCAGDTAKDVELKIDITGVPPLSLRWSKDINGKKEHFLVEGIEDQHVHKPDDSESELHRANYAPQRLEVPLSPTLHTLGRHLYVLESIIDGLGNVVHLDSSESYGHHDDDINTSKTSRVLSVLRRPKVSFNQCRSGIPMSLLIGEKTDLHVSISDADKSDGPWNVAVKYDPSAEAGKKAQSWTKSLQTGHGDKKLTLAAEAPGEYTIQSIKGKYCEGDVLEPEICKVVEKPRPRAEIEWTRIHECSGDTGVLASLVFHGTAPFQVYYRTKRDDQTAREMVKTFANSRGELTLQPEHSGHYRYNFFQISDANYKKVDLSGPSIEQVVHPLATAEFSDVGSSGPRKKISGGCEENNVNVKVDLRGSAPWNLELQVISPSSADTISIKNITSSPATFQIPVPDLINKEGGVFDIDLVNIEDANGCKRPVVVPGLSVNVRRVKPTAKFYGKEGQRQVTVLENERAELPLRLTGEKPWKIRYRLRDSSGRIETATLTSPNDHLPVLQKGTYELVYVQDAQCPGVVVEGQDTYDVDWVPRPSARLAPETKATYEAFNRSQILDPICQGRDDHVDLELTGRAPFQIMYNIARNDEHGGTAVLDQPTFSSIQPRTRFQLHTSTSGRKYYEVKQIGDAVYPLAQHKNAIVPRSERLLFEQEVLMRPTAAFKSDTRMQFCLNEAFTSHNGDGYVQLQGTPPFQVEFAVKSLVSSQVHTETVEVPDRIWKLDLPSYSFSSIGPHRVSIVSIQDASHCEQAELDPERRAIWVDVAEAPSIIPIDQRADICVGDVTRFQLEGTPPWSVGYRINGKPYTQDAKSSPFSLLQQQAGEFTVTSVAHQHKLCKATVTDLHYNVHELPSAQVGHGKRVYQDIHEGSDQAEILFTLIGEPPFTFTYQRAEASPRKGGKPGKVLETHTVSGVTTNEYSIFSALEGTWTVTSITDRHCRYPPNPAGTGDKQR